MSLITVHLTVLTLTVLVIILADKEGLAWMRGKKEVLDARKIHRLHILMWVGLVLMVLTGGIMASSAWSYFLSLKAFQLKMLFVAALIVNGLVIGSLSKVATEKPFRELALKEKLPLFASGMISFVGWIGAFVAANFIH